MKYYQTPIFPLEVNQKSFFTLTLVIADLHSKGDFIQLNKDAEEEEYTIELQLPFICKMFGK